MNQWPPVPPSQSYHCTKPENRTDNSLSLVNKNSTWWQHRHKPLQPQTVLRGVLSQELLKPLCLPLKNVLTHNSIGELIIHSLSSVPLSILSWLTSVQSSDLPDRSSESKGSQDHPHRNLHVVPVSFKWPRLLSLGYTFMSVSEFVFLILWQAENITFF